MVKNASTGFNGGAPSGHTTVAGVNLTETPNYKNYTAQYTNVNRTDLIKKMRTAHRKIRFKSPISINDYRNGRGDRYRIYTTESVLSSLEDEGFAQNENLGRDIAQLDNTIVFRNHPVIWVPKLDSDTQAPVYMIDHSQSFMRYQVANFAQYISGKCCLSGVDLSKNEGPFPQEVFCIDFVLLRHMH